MPSYAKPLVEAAMAGDREAISALIAAAQPDVRRFARRTCRGSSDIEDAVQETLFVLYRRVAMLRDAAALSGWLFRITRRACLALAARVVAVDLDEIDRETAALNAPPAEVRLDLANAIQWLPPDYREIVLLRDVEELTIDEIARARGLTREAVKGRLHRARGLLREYLIR